MKTMCTNRIKFTIGHSVPRHLTKSKVPNIFGHSCIFYYLYLRYIEAASVCAGYLIFSRRMMKKLISAIDIILITSDK